MKKVLWASFVFGACAYGQAQLYVYDDFSAVGSGSGWTAGDSWDGLTLTSASPLATGTGQYGLIGGGGVSYRRISAAAKASIDARTAGGQSFWLGYLTRWSGNVGPGMDAYGGVQLRQGAGDGIKRFFTAVPYNSANWGAARDADDFVYQSSTAIGAGTVFLSFDINLSTHLADMYIGNVLAINDMALDTATVLFTTLEVLKLEAGGSATQQIAVDELRIGATSADVQPVPEPATIAALSLGALALLRKRRR